jgi:hypothetical protein
MSSLTFYDGLVLANAVSAMVVTIVAVILLGFIRGDFKQFWATVVFIMLTILLRRVLVTGRTGGMRYLTPEMEQLVGLFLTLLFGLLVWQGWRYYKKHEKD